MLVLLGLCKSGKQICMYEACARMVQGEWEPKKYKRLVFQGYTVLPWEDFYGSLPIYRYFRYLELRIQFGFCLAVF